MGNTRKSDAAATAQEQTVEAELVIRPDPTDDPAFAPDPDDHYPAAVTYIGEYDAVDVNRPDGTRGRVSHGQPFKTTNEHADSLLEQAGNWART